MCFSKDNIIKTRRKFHKMAEPGWLEFETTIKLIQELKQFGYSVNYGKSIHSKRLGLPTDAEKEIYQKNVNSKDIDFDISEILDGYTGLTATIKSHNPGPNIAIRYDIDANDITESEDTKHKPYALNFNSKNPNAMHACAHDGHITIGVFLAKWISKNINKLKGTYTFIFEPAEEGARGSFSLVNAGVLDGIDIILSGHIGLGLPSKNIGIGTIGFLGTTKYNITFKGKTAHAGAKPEEGKNALLGASAFILALSSQTQFSEGMSRVNIGKINSGTGRNIVPGEAFLILETRGETENINQALKSSVINIAKGAATMFGLDVNIDEVGSAPSYENKTSKLRDNFFNYMALKENKPYKIIKEPILGASEDVARMLNFIENNGGQSIHMIYGSNLKAGHHNENFDFDEETLFHALDIMIEAINYINNNH